jgi:hypothetical protein
MRSYEARHHAAPSEREAGEPPRGHDDRFAEDGYDPDRIDAALENRDQGPGGDRPDHAIADDLRRRLSDDPSLDATDVRIEVEQGVVSLAGTVESRDDKRHVEDLARSAEGVREIVDALEIQSDRLGPLPGPVTPPR